MPPATFFQRTEDSGGLGRVPGVPTNKMYGGHPRAHCPATLAGGEWNRMEYGPVSPGPAPRTATRTGEAANAAMRCSPGAVGVDQVFCSTQVQSAWEHSVP